MEGAGGKSFESPLGRVDLQDWKDDITIRDKDSWNGTQFYEAKNGEYH